MARTTDVPRDIHGIRDICVRDTEVQLVYIVIVLAKYIDQLKKKKNVPKCGYVFLSLSNVGRG